MGTQPRSPLRNAVMWARDNGSTLLMLTEDASSNASRVRVSPEAALKLGAGDLVVVEDRITRLRPEGAAINGKRVGEKAAFYRQRCLDCHGAGKPRTKRPRVKAPECSVPSEERAAKASGNNCLTCHMPRSDTDIPHLRFAHHRIGKHATTAAAPERTPNLVPIGDVSHLAEIDQKRNLGLAYLEAA